MLTLICAVDRCAVGQGDHTGGSSSRVAAHGVVGVTVGCQMLVIKPFYIPESVICHSHFGKEAFNSHVVGHEIDARPIQPLRHNWNVLEAMHKVFRDIFLELKAVGYLTSAEVVAKLLVQKVIRISNYLSGNDIMSTHELAEGYTRPI